MIDTGKNTGKEAFAAALAAVVIGAGVLAGWLFDLEFLKRIAPGLVAMNPVTAAAFILAGASLALFLLSPRGKDQKSRALILTARLCALVVTLIGLAKLAGILCGWDLGVDRWLFASQLPDSLRFPNRMAPNTAFNFLLLGGALLFVDVKNRSARFWSEFSVVLVGFGSLLAVLAYAYDIQSFYGFSVFIPMALHTAITFSVLAVAFILSHTDSGLLAVFVGDSAGGTIARRLLPAVVLVPAVLGWLTLQGEKAGIFHGQFSHAVFALGNILVFAFLVCWSAKGLFSADLGRKKAEEALRESQGLYLSLVEQLPANVYRKDAAGRFIFVNSRFCQIKGKTADEILGQTASVLDSKALAAETIREHELIMRTGQTIEKEESYTQPDGTVQYLQVMKGPVLAADGRVVGSQGIQFDISERKQAEDALLQSEEQFRAMFELASVGIAQADPRTGQWVRVNQKMCEITGYSADELLQMRVPEMTHPEDRQSDREKFERVVRGEAPDCRMEKRYIRKDGRLAWVNVNMTIIRDAAGQPTRTVAAIEDITERKLVQESHDRLAMAVEQATETVVITDTQGTILYANPAFEKTSGYTRAEALGQNPRVLKSGKHNAEFYHQMWAVLQRAETWNGHFINKRKDGTLYEEEATISPVRDAAGTIVNYVAVKRDVTREVQIESQFRQSQKMEAFGQLAGGVAHDFNNILAVIQLQAGLLKSESTLTAQQLEFAGDIEKATKRAADLTRQLLLFSRKQTMQSHNLKLKDLVDNMTRMLQRTLGEQNQLQFKFAKESLVIHADPGMMDQILLNLTVNARDAMPNGGQIIIETSVVEFDEVTATQIAHARPGLFVCLSVSDTGCGIPPEILPRIFEPFFTTKDVGKGTGLGLATVFGIVQQHQGWIHVYSEVNRGTTFRVYLPRQTKPSDTEFFWSPLASIRGGSETILLVEDEYSVRTAMRIVLSRLGYRVLEASKGDEALTIWKQHRAEIRLLLTDLVMPGGMNGNELAAQFLQENPKLKVIYASGYSVEVAGKDLLLEDGINFLAKPFQSSKLAQTVRHCLDQN